MGICYNNTPLPEVQNCICFLSLYDELQQIEQLKTPTHLLFHSVHEPMVWAGLNWVPCSESYRLQSMCQLSFIFIWRLYWKRIYFQTHSGCW